MYYTGIGSRQTPPEIGVFMTRLAMDLSELGFTLRSGAANGADMFFEAGAHLKHIYLPWRGFNGNSSDRYTIDEEAMSVAKMHHPAWDRLSPPVKKLMARNVYQVLGQDLSEPSLFLVCWTADGCESYSTRSFKTGGTGLAISLASVCGVPVYNLANASSMTAIRDKVDSWLCSAQLVG